MHTSPRVLYVLFIVTLCLNEENAMNLDHKHALSPAGEINVSTFSLDPNRKRRSDDILSEDDEIAKRIVDQQLDDFYFLGEVLPEDRLSEETINVSHGLDSPASTLQMFDPGGSATIDEPEMRLENRSTTQQNQQLQPSRKVRDQLIHTFRTHHHHSEFKDNRHKQQFLPSERWFSEGKPTGYSNMQSSFGTNVLDGTQLSENTNRDDVINNQQPNDFKSPDSADESLSEFAKSSQINQKGISRECRKNLGQYYINSKHTSDKNEDELQNFNNNSKENSPKLITDSLGSILEINYNESIPKNSKILVRVPSQIYIKPSDDQVVSEKNDQVASDKNDQVVSDKNKSCLNIANDDNNPFNILINQSVENPDNLENSKNHQLKEQMVGPPGGYQINKINNSGKTMHKNVLQNTNMEDEENDQSSKDEQNINMEDEENEQYNKTGYLDDLQVEEMLRVLEKDLAAPGENFLKGANQNRNYGSESKYTDHRFSSHGNTYVHPTSQVMDVDDQNQNTPSQYESQPVQDLMENFTQPVQDQNSHCRPNTQPGEIKGSIIQPRQSQNTPSELQLESIDVKSSLLQPRQTQCTPLSQEAHFEDLKGRYPKTVNNDRNSPSQPVTRFRDFKISNPETLGPTLQINVVGQPTLQIRDYKIRGPEDIRVNVDSQAESPLSGFKKRRRNPEIMQDNLPSQYKSQLRDFENIRPKPTQLRGFEGGKPDLDIIKFGIGLPSPYEWQSRTFDIHMPNSEQLKELKERKFDSIPNQYESQIRNFEGSKLNKKNKHIQNKYLRMPTPTLKYKNLEDYPEQLGEFKESKFDPETIKGDMQSQYELHLRDFEVSTPHKKIRRIQNKYLSSPTTTMKYENLEDNPEQLREFKESKFDPETIKDYIPNQYESQLRYFKESRYKPDPATIKDNMPSQSGFQSRYFEGIKPYKETRRIQNKDLSSPTPTVKFEDLEIIKPTANPSDSFVIQLNQIARQTKDNTNWLEETAKTYKQNQEHGESYKNEIMTKMLQNVRKEENIARGNAQWLAAMNYVTANNVDNDRQLETRTLPQKRLFRRELHDVERTKYGGVPALQDAKIQVGPTSASVPGNSDPLTSRRLERMTKLLHWMRNMNTSGAYASQVSVPAFSSRQHRSFNLYNTRATSYPVKNSSSAPYPVNQLVSYNPLISNMPPEYQSNYKSPSPGSEKAHKIPSETFGQLRHNNIPADTSQFLRYNDISPGASQFTNHNSLNDGAVSSHNIPSEASQFSSLNSGPLKYNDLPVGTSQFLTHHDIPPGPSQLASPNSLNSGPLRHNDISSETSQFMNLNSGPLKYNGIQAGASQFTNQNSLNYGADISHGIPSDTAQFSSVYSGLVTSNDTPSETSQVSSLNSGPVVTPEIKSNMTQLSKYKNATSFAKEPSDEQSNKHKLENEKNVTPGAVGPSEIQTNEPQFEKDETVTSEAIESPAIPSNESEFEDVKNAPSEAVESSDVQSNESEFDNDENAPSEVVEPPEMQSKNNQIKNKIQQSPEPERCFEVPLKPSQFSHHNSLTYESILPNVLPETSQFFDQNSYIAKPRRSFNKNKHSRFLNKYNQRFASERHPTKEADYIPEMDAPFVSDYGTYMERYDEDAGNDVDTAPIIRTADGLFMLQPVEEEDDELQPQSGGEEAPHPKATLRDIKPDLVTDEMGGQKRDCGCGLTPCSATTPLSTGVNVNPASNLPATTTPIKPASHVAAVATKPTTQHNGSLPYEVFADGAGKLSQHKDIEEDVGKPPPQKSINETAVLQKMLDELRQIKSETPVDKSKNGLACTVEGTWITEVAGIKMVIAPREKGQLSSLSVNVMDRKPPMKQALLSKDWTISARVPFKIDGPFFLSGVSHGHKVARFIGQCRVCHNKDIVTGIWSFAHSAHDCRELDMGMTTLTRRDVFRREVPLTTTTEAPEITASTSSCDHPIAKRDDYFLDDYDET